SGIENVVRNAIRYTAPGTAVEVQLSWKLDSATLTVRDYGPGVPEAELGHIFEPFYRVSEARERATAALGLALSIPQRTVKPPRSIIRADNFRDGLLIPIELPRTFPPAPTPATSEKIPVT